MFKVLLTLALSFSILPNTAFANRAELNLDCVCNKYVKDGDSFNIESTSRMSTGLPINMEAYKMAKSKYGINTSLSSSESWLRFNDLVQFIKSPDQLDSNYEKSFVNECSKLNVLGYFNCNVYVSIDLQLR